MKTITHRFARTAMLLVLAMLTTNMWAQINLTQDANGNYLINNEADWNTLADYVKAGNTCQGMTFLMTDNIGTAANPITRPVGEQIGSTHADRKRFAGTFDGGGNTLTIALNTTDQYWSINPGYCAPFAYTVNATFKNLHVAGSIITEGTWASGLVGSTGDGGSGTCTIDSCEVAVAITANYVSHNNKYGNHGGFIGIAEGKATITNSWFDGKFLGVDYKYSAGFIGMNKGKKTTLTNCLFNPSEIASGLDIEGSCEFVHSLNGGTDTLVNAYWVMHFGEPENAQGQRVYADKPDTNQYACDSVTAADGVIYYIITGNFGWAALQEALTNGTTYSMTKDMVAGSTDAALVVPANVSATLNMNGYTIDRGLLLEPAQTDGYVIKVEAGGTLTINGGTITGGNNNGNCGGIYNAGTLNLNGTTITGNYSRGHGAGIYNAGTLNIVNATITGNTGRQAADRGLGVYVANNAAISIQGNVQIHDNYYTYYSPTQMQEAHNLYLGSAVMTVAGSLDSGSLIRVEGKTGVITDELENRGDLSNFTSDDSKYGLFEDAGEAKMDVYVTITVNGYGNSTESDYWYFIATPLVDGINPANVEHLINSNHNGKDYDLYRFNEGANAGSEWENYKNQDHADFTFVNGQGYLYANKKKAVLSFLGNYNTNSTQTVDLNYTAGKEHAGVNLVGNPFPVNAYIADRSYYVMNPDGSAVTATPASANDPIAPCMGVIVKAEEDEANPQVTFSTSAPQKASGLNNQGNINIVLSQQVSRGNAVLDNAVISFNEADQLGKFVFKADNAKVYIPQNDKDYAIAFAGSKSEMPVNFKAGENGSYTLSINIEDVEMNYLHLIDNLTGADVDLLATPSYPFNAKTDDYASRFRLVFKADSSDNTDSDNFAFVSNGQIIVNGQGTVQVCDVTGRMISSYNDVNHITTEGMTAGVYVIRLVNGDSTKTQKVVVK